ncbi:GNAT family N-acetyltransferase [Erythrobacter sp. HL-111]|uniref:GNAT family N-acetyltransferase n=1 Tax=Erythrobacter sp. HL-111 TaxID=1798193 RepID=UPI0006DBB5CE|nr:GNAT family N-acetyltransferase [Erythrobacter sp. HL-111]KPP85265.1 MAG: putative acetyltransferase [Erythrobacteraceae bacterium HL-111]SDS21976.1 Acetyltransferase (GNAT) family protein [Erythrobacter sp. HL-111]
MQGLIIRDARPDELDFVTGLIADDALAVARDPVTGAEAAYQREAFEAIAADPCHRLLIAELDGERVGSFQLSFIPGVALGGASRGQIEFVRVASPLRGRGIGEAMMRWAIEECRARGCYLVQLTSDHRRPAAHRFYERLGFTASHAGFKLRLIISARPSTQPGR